MKQSVGRRPKILSGHGSGVVSLIQALGGATPRLGWRAVRLLGLFSTNWRSCWVEGPDGAPFLLDLRQSGATQLFEPWNSATIASLLSQLPENAVALDIGAHVGVFARQMAVRFRHGRVYAFEPSPETFAVLQHNAAAHPRITCEQVAIADHDGTVFFARSSHSKLRHIAARASVGTEQVPSRTLESWVRERRLARLDFIKIDVEGFEEDVLIPARELLARFQPVVCFEYSRALARVRSRFAGDALFPLWRELGYTIRRLDKAGAPHELGAVNVDWTNDYVACPAGRGA